MKTQILFFLLILSFNLPAQQVITTPWQKLLNSENLPKGIKLQKAQNNLDISFYQGRYYVAIRTAPSHFASKKVVLFVLSSADFKTWDLETKLHMGSDMREPRFAVYHDTLFFYFFKAGAHPLRFEPHSLYVSTKTKKEAFTTPETCQLNGFVPWRIRERNDTLYMSAYYGIGLYSNQHQADLRLFRSTNGKTWNPISPHTQVKVDHAEEGEFIFDNKGELWSTIRLESVGGMLAHAQANQWDQWEIKSLPEKYDSAILFEWKDDIYLVSRRNLDGKVDHSPAWFGPKLRRAYNLFRYSLTEKRTALFKLNKEKFTLEHLVDFQSTGDNAFPGIVSDGKDGFYLLNYSSNINGRAKNWLTGQVGSTYVYWTHICIK
jgi:hypothetical protein